MAELFFTVKVARSEHPKWRALAKLGHVREACATSLWIALMGACARHQNGGRVAPATPASLAPAWPAEARSQALADLEAHGLLDAHDEGGWTIHDFDEHQHELLSAKSTDDDEPPPGLSVEDRRKWLAARRSRRSRRSKRDANRPQRDAASTRSVTERDGDDPRSVTERDAERDGNTPKRDADSVTESVTRHADPSRSVTLLGGPRHASPFFSTDRDRDQNSDAGAREEESHAASRVTQRHADRHAEEEASENEMPRGFVELCRSSFAKAYRDRDLLLPPECKLGNGHHPRMLTIARSLETEANLQAALRGFFGDSKTAAEGYPIVFLERNPNRYVQAGRSGAQATAPSAGQATPAQLPPWMPGGPQAVVGCSLDELVAKLRTSMEQVIRADGTTNLALPIELREPERHAPTWRSLATWACSRTYRCRIGDRETAPDPEHPVSRVWRNAVRGWLADPLAIARGGEGGELTMELLVNEPERMWAEGRHMGGRP